MKRKLLSLTLVLALVLSLVPMGAFAANGDAVAATSIVSVDKTSITADYNSGDYSGSAAEFTVYARTGGNAVAGEEEMYIVSSRLGVDVVTKSGLALPVALPQTFVADSAGKLTFKVMTPATGTFKIGVFLTKPGEVGGSTAQDFVNVLNGTTTGTLNATTLKLLEVKEIKAVAGGANSLVEEGTFLSPGSGVKANGIDKYEYSVTVKAANGAPVAGEKVTFSTSNASVTLSASEITTNAAGIAKVKVYSTKPGPFVVEARNGDNVVSESMTFDSTGVSALEFLDDQDQKIAKDQTNTTFDFKLLDQNNNVITPSNGSITNGTNSYNNVKASIETEPTGSDLAAPTITGMATDKKVRVTIVPKLQYEGNYVLRLALENGKKIDVKFTVAKQGTITDLNFTYKETVVAFGATSAAPNNLARLDAAGISKDIDTNDVYFVSSDAQVATVGTDGKVYVANDKDNVGKKFTVTVVDKVKNLSKSVEFTVGGKVATVKAEAPVAAEVGKDASVKLSVVDNKGQVVAGYNNFSVENIVVLNKADGVIVSHEAKSTFTADILSKGYSTITVNSNKAGIVKLQVIITDGTTKYSTVVDVNFGAQAVVSSKTVVLTIGSKTGFNNNAPVTSDLAPFIQDGRTFVPVSFIAAQMGGTAEFTKNAAGLVDTVTVKVGNTTVVLTIGSTTIKVVKDGKESTVTTDVAPFIKSGRTVLPFRAVAEAFGAKVSFGPETGAVEWVKFEM